MPFSPQWLRPLLTIALAATALQALPAAASDQPAVIRLLVPVQPGGGLDAISRTLADELRQRLGTQVVVENKPGAGGVVAAQAMKAGADDGSVYMVTTDQLLILPYTLRNIGFDPLKDFTPVAGINKFDVCFAVNTAQTQARTLNAYLEEARGDREKLSYGVPSQGSMSQFLGHVLSQGSGLQLQSVAYKGAAPLINDLAGGHLPAAVIPCRDAAHAVQSGKVRFVASIQKHENSPELPTFVESGYDIRQISWIGVFTSNKTPAARRQAVEQAIHAAMTEGALTQHIRRFDFIPAFQSGQELLQASQTGQAFWKTQIEQSGFTPQ